MDGIPRNFRLGPDTTGTRTDIVPQVDEGRSGGNGERKNKGRRKAKGQRQNHKEEPKARPIEAAVQSGSQTIRNTLTSMMTRERGILRVGYKIKSTVVKDPPSARLLLQIVDIACKAGTDTAPLIKELENRLVDNVKFRKGEMVELFIEVDGMEITNVKSKDESKYLNEQNLVDLGKESAAREKQTQVAPDAQVQTPSQTLQIMRKVFLGHRNLPPRPLDRLATKGKEFARGLIDRRRARTQEASLASVQMNISAEVARDLQDFRELKGRHEVAVAELGRIKAEKRNLDAELKTAHRDRALKEGALTQKVADLETQLSAKEADVLRLEQEIAKLSKKQDTELGEERAQNERLRTALSAAEKVGKSSGSELEQARARIQALDDQVARMAIILESSTILKTAEGDKLQEQGAALARLVEENDELRNKQQGGIDNEAVILELNSNLGRLTANLESANKVIEELRRELDAAGIESNRARDALKDVVASPAESAPAEETTRVFEELGKIVKTLGTIERDAEFVKITNVIVDSLKDPRTSADKLTKISRLLDEALQAQRDAAKNVATPAVQVEATRKDGE